MAGLTGIAVPLADTWGMHGGDVGGGWWIVMMIGMIAFWSVVIYGVFWFVRGGFERNGPSRPEKTPLETLDRRLAEGEITPAEHAERQQILDRRGGGEPRKPVPA